LTSIIYHIIPGFASWNIAQDFQAEIMQPVQKNTKTRRFGPKRRVQKKTGKDYFLASKYQHSKAKIVNTTER